MDRENYVERNERLGSQSQRQAQIGLMLSEFELPRGADAEPDIEALRMLLVDGLMDHDDYALRLIVDGLHRLITNWSLSRSADEAVIENRGELKGLHNVASMALERMVPLAILAEVSRGGLQNQILSHVVENPGCSNEDLINETGADKTQVSRAGRRLSDAGLVRKRRTGTRNAWVATPRGVGALHAAKVGHPRSIGRARAAA
jgi:hypothetical protein